MPPDISNSQLAQQIGKVDSAIGDIRADLAVVKTNIGDLQKSSDQVARTLRGYNSNPGIVSKITELEKGLSELCGNPGEAGIIERVRVLENKATESKDTKKEWRAYVIGAFVGGGIGMVYKLIESLIF